MQKLVQANLYHANPIKINGFLIERYNECLNLLGIKPTNLTQFTIDAKGWSPEIAQEKNEIHYLNNGDANNHAIIISPQQKDKEVLEPFHHFDQELIHLVFTHYEDVITDITKESAICLDFNQGIDVYNNSFDLLKYNKVEIKFYLTNDLKKVKEEQLALADDFDNGNNFIDVNLHQKILQSVRKYGDLRNRDVNLKPLFYAISSFYTKAFGGVFIFKDFIKPLFVFESREYQKKAISNTSLDVLIYHVSDTELVDKLEDYIVIDNNVSTFIKSDKYNRVKKHVFAQLFSNLDHEFETIFTNELIFKRYLNQLDEQGRTKLLSIENYAKDSSNFVSDDLWHTTYYPHSSLTTDTQDLLWKLLTKIAPKDPLYMFQHTKNLFKDNFSTWNESYKDYIINYIKKHTL